jgi:hypothetical protein
MVGVEGAQIAQMPLPEPTLLAVVQCTLVA